MTGEMWKNIFSVSPRCEHCELLMIMRGEKSFNKSGAALTEDMGMHVSKMWESIETHIQASLKTAQDLSVDLNDCVNDVQVNSLQYCSDQDEIHATVSKSFIRVDMPLVRSSCNSVGVRTCTGRGDPSSAIPFCYLDRNWVRG